MSSQATSDFRRRRKINLIQVCGNKCNICGYNKAISALEFHHIIPEEKEYGIASTGTCHDIEKDLKEVRKCILVCANCHREIHEGQYTTEKLFLLQFFDEKFAEQLLKERNEQFYGKDYFCSQCGKKLSGKSITGLCEECYHKSIRVVERPNREELKQLIQHNTFTQLGRMYNVSDNTIRKWCKIVNLPSRKKDIDCIKDWDQI